MILHFDGVASLLQQINHLLAVEHEVDPGQVDALDPQLLLQVLLEEDASRSAVRQAELVGVHQLELLPMPGPHIDLDVVVGGGQVELVVRLPESAGVLLVHHNEAKSQEGSNDLD